MNNNITRLDQRSTKQIFYANETDFFKIKFNGGTTSSSNTSSYNFGSGCRMNFKIDFNSFHKYSQIKSITLKVRFETTSASVKFNNEGSLTSNYGVTNENYTSNSRGYVTVDLMKYCNSSQIDANYFSLVSNGSYTIYKDTASTKINRPQLIVEYIDDKESIVNQKTIDGSAGRALSYSVNARSGKPTYVKTLLSIPTTVVPINLGLYFDPLNCDVLSYYMPRGWRFNYNQKIMANSEGYEYIDGNGIHHQFNQSCNNSNVYFDIAGTGLILTKSGASYTIDNGYNNYLYFNSGGKLTKLSKKIYSQGGILNEYGIQIGYYDVTDNISTISEFKTVSGTTTTSTKITIDYTSTSGQIKITSTGFPSITLSLDSSSRLSGITEEDSKISNYTYDSSYNLLSVYCNNGEKATFTYDSRNRIQSIVDSVYLNNTDTIVGSQMIEYKYMSTCITNMFGVTYGYVFNGDGTLISEYELEGDDYKNYHSIEKTDEGVSMDLASNEVYLGYQTDPILSSSIEATTKELNVDSNVSKGNLVLDMDNYFILSFVYRFGEETGTITASSYSEVSVEQMGEVIDSIELNVNALNDTKAELIFRCIDDSKAIKLIVKNNYNHRTLYLKNIKINQLNKAQSYYCTNTNLGNSDCVTLGGSSYYKYPCNEFYYNSSVKCGGRMYYDDLVENIKNVKLNGTTHHIWYNQKRGLIANTSDVKLINGTSTVSLSNIVCGIYTMYKNKVVLNYSEYNNSTTGIVNPYRIDYSKLLLNNSTYTLSTKYINKNHQEVKSVGINGIISQNTFDDIGNVLEEKMCNSTDGRYYLRKYTYENNLLNKVTEHIDGKTAITTYNINQYTGNVEKITNPDGSVTDYTYHTNTIGKINKITTEVSDNVVNSNTLTYNCDKPYKQIGMNTGLEFYYDKYNMINLMHNNSRIALSITRQILEDGYYEIERLNAGSNYYIKRIYDKYGNLIEIQDSTDNITFTTVKKLYYVDLDTDDITTLNVKTNSKSKLRYYFDNLSTDKVKYFFDNLGKLVKETHKAPAFYPNEITYTYDDNDRITNKEIETLTSSITETVNYKNDYENEVTGANIVMTHNLGSVNATVTYTKNNLGDLSQDNITSTGGVNLKRVFRYAGTSTGNGNVITSNYPNGIEFFKGGLYTGYLQYTYDNMGRIANITDGTINITYKYDVLGRIVRENNSVLNTTTLYSYDINGNILSKKVGDYTTGNLTNYTESTYTYATTFSDMITSYNGQTITTSLSGYITQIGATLYQWTRGRYLDTVQYSAAKYIKFKYNNEGRRIQKTYTNSSTVIKHNYTLDGNRILSEEIIGGSYAGILHYIYLNGSIVGFSYKGINYFFQKNLQNDIIGIYNESNNLVARYEYDSWGNHKVYDSTGNINTLDTFIGNINPFRYKGYYYDKETGYFWLSSRYYSPELCRFISPADVSNIDPYSINGLNLYAYANNNPIGISKSTNKSHATLLNGSMMTHIVPSLNKFTSGISASGKNYWNPHWKNKWFDTDLPGFFVLSQEGFEVVNWSLSIYKGSLYFDNNENHSLYISAGNIGVYAGINYKEGIGIDAGASVLEIGYDGRIIDASIEGLTIGITYMYKDGKFEFGYGAGWFGWSVSIDFVELFKLLFGGE